MKWLIFFLWFSLATVMTITGFARPQDVQLPEGEGKDIVAGKCSICHSLDRITATHATQDGWEKIVKEMMEEGAPLEDAEIATVVKYLVKNFGPAK
jgi:mono/diheme cytochrome c family protein